MIVAGGRETHTLPLPPVAIQRSVHMTLSGREWDWMIGKNIIIRWTDTNLGLWYRHKIGVGTIYQVYKLRVSIRNRR
jgi:hypothetical protein